MPSEFNLNKEQQDAVNHQIGPLLIIAGAGTGKTRVICETIRKLISQDGVSPKNILALTFTEKASGEMLDRVGDLMPLGYEEPNIATFHSFAERILRDKGLEIGLDPTFKILTTSNAYILFKKNLFKFDLSYFRPLGNPNKFIGAILKFFSRLQDEVVSPLDFSDYVKNLDPPDIKWQELSKAYSLYTELKLDNSFLDFGDLINYALRLFKERPKILEEYQNTLKHVFVDEFQDTNWAQYELIKLLCPASANPHLVVVGDDNQSIYKFRGAAISNIINFKKDYPQTKSIVLNKNYRSFQDILDASYRLIKNNDPDTLEAKLGIVKNLESQKEKSSQGNLQYNILATEEDEAEFIVKKILELMGENPKYTYKDFAVLARANTHLEGIVATLRRYGLPYQIVGNRGLFDVPQIKSLICFLRFLIDESDNVSLYQFLVSDFFNLPGTYILQLLKKAKTLRCPLWEVFLGDASFKDQAILINRAREMVAKENTSRVLYNFLVEVGYAKNIINTESLENKLVVDNLNLFFKAIKTFESQNNQNSVLAFVEYLDLILEAGENPAQAQIEDIDTINLITVHGSKGLEFPVVFLISLTSDRFPSRSRGDLIEIPEELIKETLPTGDYHLEEERRLFYVGVTRAQDQVYLSYAKNYGGVKEKKPSGFIAELGLTKDTVKDSSLIPTKQLNLLFALSEKIPIKPHKIADGEVAVSYVSYSQIDMFKKCPLQYKYRYILSIQTPPNHAFTFGQSIHITLRDFEKQAVINPKLATIDELLRIYEKNFDPSGYETKEHKEKRFLEGKKYLKIYFERGRQLFGKPKMLEEKFRLLVGGVPLIGVIDRIDERVGGVEIVDYKTGGLKEQKEVDRDMQLTYYALACRDFFKLPLKSLSLYFFEDAQKISTTRTDADLESVKEDIVKTVKEIKVGNFEAKTSPLCKYCDYRHICPAYKNYLNI